MEICTKPELAIYRGTSSFNERHTGKESEQHFSSLGAYLGSGSSRIERIIEVTDNSVEHCLESPKYILEKMSKKIILVLGATGTQGKFCTNQATTFRFIVFF